MLPTAAAPQHWHCQYLLPPPMNRPCRSVPPRESPACILMVLQEMQPNEPFTFYGTSAATSAVHTAVLGSLCAAAVALLALA